VETCRSAIAGKGVGLRLENCVHRSAVPFDKAVLAGLAKMTSNEAYSSSDPKSLNSFVPGSIPRLACGRSEVVPVDIGVVGPLPKGDVLDPLPGGRRILSR
jgi:hypothetical protein